MERFSLANYDFKLDLDVAKKTEKKVSAILLENFGWTTKHIGSGKGYDLLLEKDGKHITVEVKEDFISDTSGNIAIEFESRRKPSGISVTSANYWVYVVHSPFYSEFIWISTSKIRAIISNRLYKTLSVGGDKDSNTKFYLFDRKVFLKYSHIIHDESRLEQ